MELTVVTRRVSASTHRAWLILMLLVAISAACAPSLQSQPVAQAEPLQISQLWSEPADITSRDLIYGVGGAQLAPDPNATYAFLARDTTGHSGGYDVQAPDGTKWSVKLGNEAQAEVVTSRLLWAIGYHQPPTYYVAAWTLSGQDAGPKPGGRFRAELPWQRVVGDWDWYRNRFVGTREFHGLIVANLLLNNWDWKTSNNKIYDLEADVDGPRRWYVVRDLGASLGRTRFPSLVFRVMPFIPYGSRNDVEGFEGQGFIKGVRDGRVEFDYHGRHQALLEPITPADVRWTCGLMSALTDKQLEDAFRSAGYSDDVMRRYVVKLREKIGQGLGLAG